jgi:acyl-coenzyme A synthetase/AMP-(fatty) acid ligase
MAQEVHEMTVNTEGCLATHPSVADVAASPTRSTVTATYVVPQHGTIDDDALKEHIRANLARYKVPREIVAMAVLPRNATGKVVRSKLPG